MATPQARPFISLLSILPSFGLALVLVVTLAGVLHYIEHLATPTGTIDTAETEHNSARPGRPPRMRVGLYTTTEAITLVSNTPASLRDTGGNTHAAIPADTTITVVYNTDTKEYTATIGEVTYTTKEALRVVSEKHQGIITITSYSNPPAWNPDLNDNQFYDTVELHYSDVSDQIWVVNRLGIEKYIKGVAEASNTNPPAYLKALYTAARSYAYYHYQHQTKHAGEPYIVDSTANDQVYRGYGFSVRSPNVVTAVADTAGMIVHYDDQPVVTPYFSQSDGQTRSWADVWGGDNYPYLQSVADPCCTGEALLGHGVGMSARGARYLANEQYHWKEILSYYYTGITVEQLWAK